MKIIAHVGATLPVLSVENASHTLTPAIFPHDTQRKCYHLTVEEIEAQGHAPIFWKLPR